MGEPVRAGETWGHPVKPASGPSIGGSGGWHIMRQDAMVGPLRDHMPGEGIQGA
jgi:hypothetical protein